MELIKNELSKINKKIDEFLYSDFYALNELLNYPVLNRGKQLRTIIGILSSALSGAAVLNAEQIEEVKKIKEKNKEENENMMEKADKDFYTRSMDLSEEDFMTEEFKDDKLPLWVKLLILILMIAIAVVAGYFIHQNM